MRHQSTLFHDDIYDAMRTDVMAIGGWKEVSSRLWPLKKDPTSGAEYLKCCLRGDRNEKLDLEQIAAIKKWAREVESYATISFEAQEIGFDFRIIEPEEESEKLQRMFINAQENMGRLVDRMEKLNLPTTQKVRGV